MQKYSTLAVALVCAGMALWLLLGLGNIGKTKTEGTVLSAYTRIGQKGSTIHMARYAFLDTQGVEYQGEGIVSSTPQAGDYITVYYKASNPIVNQPDRGYKDYIAAVVLLLLAGLTWRRYRRLSQNPD